MGQEYHDGSRALQDRFDTRRLADRLAEASNSNGPVTKTWSFTTTKK